MLEIPVGKHVIEILYKEYSLVCWFDCLAFEKSLQTLMFITEPNPTYSPFVSDECSRTDFWIEDWGLFVASSETKRGLYDNESDLTKPVVAGEAPNKNSCK